MIKKTCAVCLICTMLIPAMLSGCEKKDKVSSINNEKVENIKLSKNETDDLIKFDLYFDSSNKKDEVEISKEPRSVDKEEIIGEILMQEIIKGPSPKSKLKPVFLKDVELLAFSIKDGIAYVNLSANAKYCMTKKQELTCLKSIVYTLSNLQVVNKVNILINNRNVDTLGGNYDISKPLSKIDVDALK